VWLDGSLSGVRMDLSPLGSSSGRMRVSSSAAPPGETGTRLASTQRPTVRSARPAAAPASPAPELRPARRWLLPALVSVALGLGLGVGLLLRGESTPAVAAAANVMPSAAPTAAALEVPAVAAEVPSAASAAATSATAPASAAASGKKPVTSPARSAPSGRPRRGKSYDFGF